MHIELTNKIITTPVETILRTAQSELRNGKLKDIDTRDKGNILITCPCHKDGMENRPSCRVSTSTETDLEPGTAYCFTCGYKAHIRQLIGDLFDEDKEFGEEWLNDHFGDTFLEKEVLLPPIDLNPVVKPSVVTLPESELLQYDFYHPYMWKRKLSKEVVDEFRVGYDKIRDAITFPVYDQYKRLVMVTARSVTTKRFWIPPEIQKPVYLLYDILQKRPNVVFVAESQINTLTLRTWGYPSIGLFGTGSRTQLETLKKSGIRNFILCFDGDYGGRKGAERFKQALGKDVFITDICMPYGKDINDLTKEEFDALLQQHS